MRFFAVLSALAALASAYTQPDYTQDPTGNAIYTPGLNDQVEAGKPYAVTWDPTTTGKISLVLLRGPSTDMQTMYAIADSIENTGTFTWTPSTSLEPDVTHYGLLLVVEGTGQYQYSTQFGITNPAYSSSAVASSTPTAAATTSAVTQAATTTAAAATTEVAVSSATSTAVETVDATKPAVNSVPVIKPTGFVTSKPSGVIASSAAPSGTPAASSSSVAPIFTGAADRKAMNLGMGALAAGVVAVLAI
ncbi:GPI anchored serine-threonine rich protein [Aspergillus saccharolyticus JOP 1030-1]|uniref:Yeast cell wall synthesis Kre9/Knh1-like N-terminal domain-containing protein n=1 Tax=Aspergillus saccharolyticus JOP 1030-1 TaxID=1450539 RepID=A0A318Z7H9_9EURO|nr:hypothetical protein BP01DRAFT_375653 [Aspergillus saccharolyticus JOP 1030-1]PYH43281.1 hypothetical protein BP01DRAFT_375653 [Aspergillus saccharolyticus JOP 1030-1]